MQVTLIKRHIRMFLFWLFNGEIGFFDATIAVYFRTGIFKNLCGIAAEFSYISSYVLSNFCAPWLASNFERRGINR